MFVEQTEDAVLASTRQLELACILHLRDSFKQAITNGADINGIEGEIDPPIFQAIKSSNNWAVYELLKYPNLDVNRYSLSKFSPLFDAVWMGDEAIIQALIARGANTRVFCGSPLLEAAISRVTSHAFLHYSIWSRESREDETTGDPLPWIETEEDKRLKKEVHDYYYQRGKYAKKDINDKIPFENTDERPISVYYRGKLEIVDLLLSAGTSMLPIAGTDATPEKLVTDIKSLQKYCSAFPGEKLERYFSIHPDMPKFGMQFRDKFGQDDDNFIEIHITYDLRPIRKRILDYLKRSASPPEVADLTLSLAKKVEDEVHERHQQFHADMDSRLATVQRRLSDVQSKQNVLSDLFQSKLENRQAVERFKAHPNLLAFYRRFYIQLEATFISFKAVSGGQVVGKSGDFAVAKSIFEFCSDSISIAPIVGHAAEKFLKWTVGAALDAADDARQGNTANNISRLVTVKEAGECAEAIARALTQIYDWQLRQLATIEQAKAKKSLLREQFIAPSEHLAVFAVAWVMDALYNIHTKTVNGQADLVQILLTQITQREPSGKLLAFWGAVTTQLGWGALPTQTGDVWSPEDLLTRPGIQTPQGYFVGEKTDYRRFGWRWGTPDDVRALGLAPCLEQMPGMVAPDTQRMFVSGSSVTVVAQANNGAQPILFAANGHVSQTSGYPSSPVQYGGWVSSNGAASSPLPYAPSAPVNISVGAPPPPPALVTGFGVYRDTNGNAPNGFAPPSYPASPVSGNDQRKVDKKKCALM